LAKPASIRHRFPVNKDEALEIARVRARELRKLPWAELRDRYLDRPEHAEVVGATGAAYQVEIFAVWDHAKGGDLRLFVAVDDYGWRAFSPLSECFIVAPDGSFVGE
jgi:hypothetical protein